MTSFTTMLRPRSPSLQVSQTPLLPTCSSAIYPDHSAGSAPNAAAPRALDLGSGRGRHTVWLAKQGWETTALDFSDVGLAHTARALAAEQLDAHLLQADLNEWEPTPESFDAIVAAFMHLPSVDQRKLWKRSPAPSPPVATSSSLPTTRRIRFTARENPAPALRRRIGSIRLWSRF